jgi:uncharacterized protein
MKLPLFPLNTVVFPESELPLRLFEPRYLDMVSECLRQNSNFGICLIEDGQEAGEPAKFFPMGTEVEIIDWNKTDDGLLGITVKGSRRFKVDSFEIQQDNLCIGEVTFLDEADESIPDAYQNFSALLKEIGNRYELPFLTESERFDDANWVSERLAELLPFELSAKQALLEMDDALHRFDYMQSLLEKIDAGLTNYK